MKAFLRASLHSHSVEPMFSIPVEPTATLYSTALKPKQMPHSTPFTTTQTPVSASSPTQLHHYETKHITYPNHNATHNAIPAPTQTGRNSSFSLVIPVSQNNALRHHIPPDLSSPISVKKLNA
jgi:hypothetical protein